MPRLKAVCRNLYWSAFVAVYCLIVQAPAWAQQAAQAKEESRGAGPWVLPYALVILCIGLGMMVLCRTSRRSDRARPQQYEALKTKD
ncbi:MAG TPA: hypothetical protein DD670_05070 [Planctomycetaceae bacterium]|nr:hypothetical protein [Planctomycetaceae bacterium]